LRMDGGLNLPDRKNVIGKGVFSDKHLKLY
jgi:hypothetical protein